MPARAVDADEDAQVDAQPLRVRGTTVSTLVVARQAANLEDDALHVTRQRLNTACLYAYYTKIT